MNIAFLCRWKLEDGLTLSTALPHLQVLAEDERVSKIIFITLEDNVEDTSLQSLYPDNPKINWQPFFTSQYKSKILNQLQDYRNGYKLLRKTIVANGVDLVIAHGAPAGAVADKAVKGLPVPYFVSLFEPHAEYMLESGVWSKYGLKYGMQQHWEKLQKKNAAGLMPVSEKYKTLLIKEGVPAEKVRVVPCSVYASVFKFDQQKRAEVRAKLGWEKVIIGIYVGKYGSLYYDDEAFEIYQECFELIPDFRLLILSPNPQPEILQQLQKYNLDPEKVYITTVSHDQVPGYLSAADFALATYKPGPSKKYLSPVKIGEYWANGLPVLLTEGIGDENDIIENEGGGDLFNLQQNGSLEQAILKVQTILGDPTHRQTIPEIAAKYRSPEKIREAYEYFFKQTFQL